MEKLIIFIVFLRLICVNSLSLCGPGDDFLEADETRNFTTFTCTGIDPQHSVAWLMTDDRNYSLGICPPLSSASGSSTCVPGLLTPVFQIRRNSATTSTISCVSGTPLKTFATSARLRCYDDDSNGLGVTCPLDYIYPPSGAACRAEFSAATWSLAVQCSTTKVRSVRGRYTCQLRQTKQGTNEILDFQNVAMSTNPVNTDGYVSGECNISAVLPSDGQYNYTVNMFPGNTIVTAVFTGDNTIRFPRFAPSHDCPMYIKENDSINCMCFVNDSGMPPGLLQWNSTGSRQLLRTRVQRQQNGERSVCSLTWNNTIQQSVIYTLIVTYPPTQLYFTFNNEGSDPFTVTENSRVIMSCQSDGRPTPNMTISKITDNRVLVSLPAGDITAAEKIGELNHTVTEAQCEDSDVYRCTADNSIGRKEQSINLIVRCKPRRDTVNATSTPSVTFEGQQVQVIFKLVAYPTPVVTSKTWLGLSINDTNSGKPANDRVMSAVCSSSSVKVYATDCTMTINSVTSDTAGFYKVNVTNEFGSLVLTFEVVLGNMTDHSDKSPVGAIAGGIVGGLVAICLIAAITIFLVTRKGKKDKHKNVSRATNTSADGSKGSVLSMSPVTESEYENQNLQGETTKTGKSKGKGAQEAKRRNENLVYTTVVFSNESTNSTPPPEADSTEYATIVEQSSAKK